MLPAGAALLVSAAWVILTASTSVRCGADGSFCGDAAARCARLRAVLERDLHGQRVGADLLADALCDHFGGGGGGGGRGGGKPLVASLHGSPGVGKSFTHRLVARALYDALDDDDEEEDGDGEREREREREEKAKEKEGPARWIDAAAGLARRVGDGFFATSWSSSSSSLSSPPPSSSRRRPRECPGADCPAYKVIFGVDYVATEHETQARLLRDALLTHLARFPNAVVVVEEYDKLGAF